MTSKLWHTLVGFGIALGTSSACAGRSQLGDAETFRDDEPDGSVPLPSPLDAGATTIDAEPDPGDTAPDATLDPFCDVAWPPTKANPYPPQTTPCFDPLGECTDAFPIECFPMLGPKQCRVTVDGGYDRNFGRQGPLICVDGAWTCGPGTLSWDACKCRGEGSPGSVCTDAGWVVAGGGSNGG